MLVIRIFAPITTFFLLLLGVPALVERRLKDDFSSYNLKDILEYNEDDRLLRFDRGSPTLCHPNDACEGIDIKTIPFMIDHVLEKFTNTQGFFDTRKTTNCLKNTRITLLGDSTMIEVANDLAILMSGLGSDSSILEKYLYRTTHVDSAYSNFKLMNHVKEDYFGNHRNMTIYNDELNIFIRSRFIGHYDLQKEDYGVLTLLEDSFQDELNCLLGFNGCPVPDVVIINSGYHDRKHPVKQFKKIVYQFLHDLKGRYSKEKMNVDIIWAGIILGTSKWKVISDLDDVAYRVMQHLRIPYINATEIIKFVPQYWSYPSMYTPDFMHFGSVAKLYDKNITGAISMLKTQRILNEVCNKYIKKKLAVKGNLKHTTNIQVA